MRLKQAYELIDKGKVSVLSLDIFDTLLWRKVPVPADVFLLLGHKLKEEGWLINAVTPISFAELRIKAEKLTRAKKAIQKQSSTSEITLTEIYWGLHAVFKKISIEQMVQGHKGIINESDVEKLVAIEVELEKSLTRFDRNIVELVKYAAQKNVAVILVSDTYFENSHLAYMLNRDTPEFAASFLSYISHIIPSCEIGRGKAHGLLAGLCEAIQGPSNKILHIGDHLKSDFQAALKVGMRAIHYAKYNTEFSDIIDREWSTDIKIQDNSNSDLVLQNKLDRTLPLLDMSQGDFGLTALRSKLLFDTALEKFSDQDAFYWKYGASIFGPVLTAFVHWIYSRCEEMKESQVLCLMREGRLYADIIKQYAPYYPRHSIEAKELWVSRQFIIRACIRYATPEELDAVLNTHPVEPFTVGTYFSALGLDLSKVRKYAKYENVKLVDENFRTEITTYLSDHEGLREQILANAAVKRKNFITYLSKVVDLSRTKHLTFVDVGWIGTIQSAVQAILNLAGYPISIHGFYLGSNYKSQYGVLQGCVREGYLLNAGFPYDATQIIHRGLHVLEQTAIPHIGSLIDFDVEGNVLTGTSHLPEKQVHQVKLVREGISAYCKRFGEAIINQEISWDSSSEKSKALIRRILMRATGYPTKHEADRFSNWRHDLMITQLLSKQNEYVNVAKDDYFDRYVSDMLPQVISKDWTMIWPAGYAAKQDKYLTLSTEAVRAEYLPLHAFLSQDAVQLKVYFDTGKGFSKKATRVFELHSNPNRSFFIFRRISSVKKPIRKIRIELDRPNCLLYIKTIRFTLERYGVPQNEIVSFFETKKIPDNLKVSGGVLSGLNTFQLKNKPLVITHTFEHGDVYAIHLRFSCEIL